MHFFPVIALVTLHIFFYSFFNSDFLFTFLMLFTYFFFNKFNKSIIDSLIVMFRCRYYYLIIVNKIPYIIYLSYILIFICIMLYSVHRDENHQNVVISLIRIDLRTKECLNDCSRLRHVFHCAIAYCALPLFVANGVSLQ